MKCQRTLCRSPIACQGFGYCRERNFEHFRVHPNAALSLRLQEQKVADDAARYAGDNLAERLF